MILEKLKTYSKTVTEKNKSLENKTNKLVNMIMILCETIMFILALALKNNETGNVIPGLTIAILGVIANSIFWYKYTKLDKETSNAI